MKPPGPYLSKGRKPTVKRRNVRLASDHGCILTGRPDGIDSAHVPYRQSEGAGWGLLEFVPLTRHWHELYDAGDAWAVELVNHGALMYYVHVLHKYPQEYLGPEWRIAEVRSWELSTPHGAH